MWEQGLHLLLPTGALRIGRPKHIMPLGTLAMATAFIPAFYLPLGPSNISPAFLPVILLGSAMASRMPIHLRIS